MEIAHKIATEGPPDLRDAWPKAPTAAAQVLQRGMALDPADRPGSAGELARELAYALQQPSAKTEPTRRCNPLPRHPCEGRDLGEERAPHLHRTPHNRRANPHRDRRFRGDDGLQINLTLTSLPS